MNWKSLRPTTRARKAAWLFAAALLLTIFVSLVSHDPADLVYGGKRLSDHIAALPCTITMSWNVASSPSAIVTVAPDSIRPKHWWPSQPGAVIEHYGRTKEELAAEKALYELGPRAFPLILKRLTRTDPIWARTVAASAPLLRRLGIPAGYYPTKAQVRRYQATTALLRLQQSGCNLKPIVPSLSALTNSPDPKIKTHAASLLWLIQQPPDHPQPTPAK